MRMLLVAAVLLGALPGTSTEALFQGTDESTGESRLGRVERRIDEAEDVIVEEVLALRRPFRPNTVHLSSDAVHFSLSRMGILLPYKALSCAFLETEEPYVTGIAFRPRLLLLHRGRGCSLLPAMVAVMIG